MNPMIMNGVRTSGSRDSSTSIPRSTSKPLGSSGPSIEQFLPGASSMLRGTIPFTSPSARIPNSGGKGGTCSCKNDGSSCECGGKCGGEGGCGCRGNCGKKKNKENSQPQQNQVEKPRTQKPRTIPLVTKDGIELKETETGLPVLIYGTENKGQGFSANYGESEGSVLSGKEGYDFNIKTKINQNGDAVTTIIREQTGQLVYKSTFNDAGMHWKLVADGQVFELPKFTELEAFDVLATTLWLSSTVIKGNIDKRLNKIKGSGGAGDEEPRDEGNPEWAPNKSDKDPNEEYEEWLRGGEPCLGEDQTGCRDGRKHPDGGDWGRGRGGGGGKRTPTTTEFLQKTTRDCLDSECKIFDDDDMDMACTDKNKWPFYIPENGIIEEDNWFCGKIKYDYFSCCQKHDIAFFCAESIRDIYVANVDVMNCFIREYNTTYSANPLCALIEWALAGFEIIIGYVLTPLVSYYLSFFNDETVREELRVTLGAGNSRLSVAKRQECCICKGEQKSCKIVKYDGIDYMIDLCTYGANITYYDVSKLKRKDYDKDEMYKNSKGR
jgi:hypothetical protein